MRADSTATPPGRRDSLAGWRELRCASWRWLVRPDVAQDLIDAEAFDPDRAASATVIKRGRHRTVWRIAAPTGEFYLKQFHGHDLRTCCRHWLRGSQARWEWSRFRLAVRRNVLTADVVAIGRNANRAAESGLVTCGLSGAMPLDQWLANGSTSLSLPQRRVVAKRLGELIGRMHGCGVTHGDLHAGNILVRVEADEPELWLVDLSPLRRRLCKVTDAETGQNLGRLRHSLLRYVSSTDQTAFFRSYWQARYAKRSPSGRMEVSHSTLREMALRCHAVAIACWEQMDRKWARGNRRVVIVESNEVHCRALAEWGSQTWEGLAREPSRLLADDSSPRALVVLDGKDVMVMSGPANRPRSGWARRCWETGHALHRRLIAAPTPIGMLEIRAGRGQGEYLLFAVDSGWVPLRSVLNDPHHRPEHLSDLHRKIARLLERFHAFGFIHDRADRSALEAREIGGVWEVRFSDLAAIRLPATPNTRTVRFAA